MERHSKNFPKPIPRASPLPREWVYHERQSFQSTLRYRVVPSSHDGEQTRWYYAGKVPVAFVKIFDDMHKSGKVRVHINSRKGNGGTWFNSLESAEKFIAAEFTRVPQ